MCAAEFRGAWAGGWAFILPNFLIVAALAALDVHFGGLSWMTSLFYGVSPAVIALILHSCYRLAKLGMEDWLQWLIAAACFVVTVTLKAEVALLFILFRWKVSNPALMAVTAAIGLVAFPLLHPAWVFVK